MSHRQLLTVVSVIAAVFLAGFLLGARIGGKPAAACHHNGTGTWCEFSK